MGNIDQFLNRARDLAAKITRLVKENKNLIVVGHLDADGIISSSLMARAIIRRRGRATVRVVSDLDLVELRKLSEGDYDFHIFCDIGGGMAGQIRDALGDRWIVLDHHQIPAEELELENVFNAWQFGYDGGKDVCSAGTIYFLALQMDEGNIDLSWLAIVAAVADRQDQGEGRSLLELNRRILNDAVSCRRLETGTDLTMYGRETKPVHEAISSTSMPFIPGLSGNMDACLAALSSAGLRLKENERWRTISELSMEEKRKVVEAIIPYLSPTSGASEIVKDLIGEVHTLVKEDERSPLRDAREFATLLNACGRMGRASLGVAICLGDRGQALQDGEKTLTEYRQALNNYLQTVFRGEGRVVEREGFVLIIGDGVVEEDMLGSFSSILSSTPTFKKRIILAKTVTKSGEAKFSARAAEGCLTSVNLGLIMRETAAASGGHGGGHDVAAGAKIPLHSLQSFLWAVEERLKG